jgi:hypothetical protein
MGNSTGHEYKTKYYYRVVAIEDASGVRFGSSSANLLAAASSV